MILQEIQYTIHGDKEYDRYLFGTPRYAMWLEVGTIEADAYFMWEEKLADAAAVATNRTAGKAITSAIPEKLTLLWLTGVGAIENPDFKRDGHQNLYYKKYAPKDFVKEEVPEDLMKAIVKPVDNNAADPMNKITKALLGTINDNKYVWGSDL